MKLGGGDQGDLEAAGTGEEGMNKIKIHCTMYEILEE